MVPLETIMTLTPDAPVADPTHSPLRSLRRYAPPTLFGPVIASLAVSHFYVDSQSRIRDVAHDLLLVQPLAVAVVDDQLRPVGLVVISRFQDQLSRPFGREVYEKRPISELMEAARVFPWDKNILTVADQLDAEIQDPKNHFFLLETSGRTYAGLFTTRDLLIHLYRSMSSDLVLARKIQEAVVPARTAGSFADLDYVATASMAKGVGGDWYHLQTLEDGKCLIAMADVSGKGAAASMVTTLLGGIVSLYDFRAGIPGLITKLNNYILATFAMERYLTAWFGVWDANTGELEVFDMGHGYALHITDQGCTQPPVDNPFLGFVPDLQPRSYQLDLGHGELLVLLTDGFAEQQDVHGAEYGVERVRRFLAQHWTTDISQLEQRLQDDVRTFRGDQPRGDDMTAIFLRRKP
jgi:sigma-B regulation protein RsbU (phosphoserine phosphatase)